MKQDDNDQQIKLVDLLPKEEIHGGNAETLFGMPIWREQHQRTIEKDEAVES